MRYFVIRPFLSLNNFELQFDGFHFFLLVLSTVFIAAAGYVINDYFDTKTDRLNKPNKVVIDKEISRRLAIKAHTILNFLGVGIGVYLSFYIGIPAISIVFLLIAGLLWFYSTNYKKEFLIGNFIVSLLTGVVPVMVVLFEIPLLNQEYGDIMIKAGANFNYIFYWISAFGFFAFLTNFIREIIKDAEDFEGDSAYGMRTLPILLGINTTKIIIGVLLLLFLAILFFLLNRFIFFSGTQTDYISIFYFGIGVLIPSLYILYKIIRAKTKADYSRASAILKFVMLFGILYSVVVYLIIYFKINI